MKNPEQLTLDLIQPKPDCLTESGQPSPLIASETLSAPAVVHDFKSAQLKRKQNADALLYAKILDSVKHL